MLDTDEEALVWLDAQEKYVPLVQGVKKVLEEVLEERRRAWSRGEG
jgi:hypothetical protein